MHLRVTIERLTDRFGVQVDTVKPTVAYRETIRDGVTVRGRHKKQSGGHGQFGDVLVEVAPRERGEGFAFAERVHGGTVPRQYFSSVEHGAKDALCRGPLGFPVVDVAVTLIDGSYHTVDSSDMAFRAAAKLALADALPKARPVLLEPIQAVSLFVPSESLARASALATARRGQILGLRKPAGLGGMGSAARPDPGSRDRRPHCRTPQRDFGRRRIREPVRSPCRALRALRGTRNCSSETRARIAGAECARALAAPYPARVRCRAACAIASSVHDFRLRLCRGRTRPVHR